MSVKPDDLFTVCETCGMPLADVGSRSRGYWHASPSIDELCTRIRALTARAEEAEALLRRLVELWDDDALISDEYDPEEIICAWRAVRHHLKEHSNGTTDDVRPLPSRVERVEVDTDG